jgi:hypothetical protein
VTDIRQDLSNNGRLAYILVACRLQTKILHNSPDLFGKISVYAGDEELFPKDSSIEIALNKVNYYFHFDRDENNSSRILHNGLIRQHPKH